MDIEFFQATCMIVHLRERVDRLLMNTDLSDFFVE